MHASKGCKPGCKQEVQAGGKQSRRHGVYNCSTWHNLKSPIKAEGEIVSQRSQNYEILFPTDLHVANRISLSKEKGYILET